MSEESKSVGDANSSVGDQDQSNSSASSAQGQVSYETYQRVMDEAKKAKATMKQLQDQVAKANEERLKAEGKKDELIESLQKKYSDLENTMKTEKAKTLIERVHGKVAEVAAKFGAYDASDVVKNVSIKDLNLDEDGNFDVKLLESKVDEIRKQKAYLFKTKSSSVADTSPNARPPNLTEKTLLDMDINKLEELFRAKAT